MKAYQQKELIEVCEEFRSKAHLTFDDWDKLGDKIYRLSLMVDRLVISRENWRNKYKDLKNKMKGGKK